MKIMVTGGLGHIGAHVIRQIPNHFPGAEVLIVDNIATQRYSSLFNLPDSCTYRFIEADIRAFDLSKLGPADFVIHLAAITDAAASFKNAEEVQRTNFECTMSVIDYCRSSRATLIFVSSTSVYGPQTENVDEGCSAGDLNPQSPYAESKLREENCIRDNLVNSPYFIYRFGTIFGFSAGIRFHTAVNKFIWQAVNGLPVTVWETAMEQFRPYLDLMDAWGAIRFALEQELPSNQIYNVLTENYRVKDIIDCIQSQGVPVTVRYTQSEIMNQQSYFVSSKKIIDHGFTYDGSLAMSVGDTVKALQAIVTSDQL